MGDVAGRRPPTIYDVARAAGVNASTVSRAFARPGRVNARTAETIRATAQRLGYRTNPLARALPTGRTSIIALTISDVANPFYAEIIRGSQEAAADADYTMILSDGQESDVQEREALERTIPIVEGLVLATSRLSDATITLIASHRPMVILNRSLAEVPSVVTDNLAGARQVSAHVYELGHRAVTYLAGPEASWVDGVRWRGLRSEASRLGMRTKRLGPYPPTIEGGELAATGLRRRRSLPSAVLAYNDQMAIGCLRSLVSSGVAVPGEVSIIGFDDIHASRLVSPALTTVAAPLRQMGAIAVHNLLAIINGAEPTVAEAFVVPTSLVVRESTGPARRN